eukprot:6211343-Pleurochrysis_carterae.AAC.7
MHRRSRRASHQQQHERPPICVLATLHRDVSKYAREPQREHLESVELASSQLLAKLSLQAHANPLLNRRADWLFSNGVPALLVIDTMQWTKPASTCNGIDARVWDNCECKVRPCCVTQGAFLNFADANVTCSNLGGLGGNPLFPADCPQELRYSNIGFDFGDGTTEPKPIDLVVSTPPPSMSNSLRSACRG